MKNLIPCEESMMHKLLAELSTIELLSVMYGQMSVREEDVISDAILKLIELRSTNQI